MMVDNSFIMRFCAKVIILRQSDFVSFEVRMLSSVVRLSGINTASFM
jgi:hypothetical protein